MADVNFEIVVAAYFLLLVWIVAVFVVIVNNPMYRLLEGYTFPALIAGRLKQQKIAILKAKQNEIDALYKEWAEKGDEFPKAKIAQYRSLRLALIRWMPSREGDILPTKFGNAIKAFEVYPRDVYGADGVAVWLRLNSVLPKNLNEKIDGLRSELDFLVNCFFFCLIISLIAVVRAAFYLVQPGGLTSRLGYEWLLLVMGAGVAALGFYSWAVSRVPPWGELVMTAFDCYLPDLAKKLGFDLPNTERLRLKFWTSLSQQFNYRRELNGKLPFRLERWVKNEKPAMPAVIADGNTGDAGNAQSVKTSGNGEDDEDEGEDSGD
jgi:hypothetical protein